MHSWKLQWPLVVYFWFVLDNKSLTPFQPKNVNLCSNMWDLVLIIKSTWFLWFLSSLWFYSTSFELSFASAWARWALKVLFPTPPFPDNTKILCFTVDSFAPISAIAADKHDGGNKRCTWQNIRRISEL